MARLMGIVNVTPDSFSDGGLYLEPELAIAHGRELARPLVVGTSRKSFLGRITGREVDERLGGTIASSVLALAAGADVLRVHDVAAVRDAVTTAEAILAAADWRR